MSYGIVATLKVQPGKEAEFEAVVRQLVADVRDHEPTTRYYECFKSQTEPGTYMTMELFESFESQVAHEDSDHFKALAPRIGATLAAPPKIDRLDLLSPVSAA